MALLGDTLHNAADALTAVPLAIAFMAGRLESLARLGMVPGWCRRYQSVIQTGAVKSVFIAEMVWQFWTIPMPRMW